MRILPLAIDDWQTGHELPDVVEGRIFGEWIFLRIQNRGESAVSGIQLVVQSSGELSSTTGPSVDLQPGQRTSVYARLAQNSDAEIKGSSCPLRVRLAVQSAGGHVVAEKEHRLLCRSYQDRFSFVYLDADGSPQLAAAKFPAVSPKTNKTACPKQGCAVLLSTHGMDVTAQRQADCYRPKQGAWVLAPHGRGTHGFNWQGPGHWSAIHALRALEQRALAWPRARVQISREPYRLIVTGHSNGGYGAWMFGTHYPDLALGVAPLAGMATIGTTEVQRPLALKDMKLWDLMAGTVEEYRGGNKRAASNLLGTRFIARTGAADRVIHPSMTHKMLTLLEDAGVTWQQKRVKYGQKFEALSIHTNITDTSMVLDKTVVVLKNKEHWWWDTKHTNDGGVMDDAQMRAFWKRCLAKEVDEQRHWPLRFFCANLASCGSPAGVQMLQQRRPGIASSFELRPPNAEAGDGSRWSLRTENCVRLRITPQRRRKWLESSALQIDGQMFDNRTFLDSSHLFCRDIDGNVDESKKADLPKWHACPLDIDQPSCTAVQDVDPAEALCCRAPARRSAERAQGPMRHVLAAPHALVWGTTGAPHTTERYRRAAVAWANAWAAVGGGVASVIADTDYIATRGEHAWTNVIAFGGIESNALSRLLSPEQPFLSLRTPSGSTGETSRIEAVRWCLLELCSVVVPFGRRFGISLSGTSTAGFFRRPVQLHCDRCGPGEPGTVAPRRCYKRPWLGQKPGPGCHCSRDQFERF
jgi:predicted esterase